MKGLIIMKNKNIIIWVVAFCLLMVAAYTVYAKYAPNKTNPSQSTEETSTSQGAQNKIMAPDFALKDLNGKEVRLSDYKGKIVILNFWATWCGYCLQEMPDLDALDKELQSAGDAVILAIDAGEPEKTVRSYIEEEKIGLKVLLDTEEEVTGLYQKYDIRGYPTTFILNPDLSFYTYIPGATNKETLDTIINMIRNGEPLR